MAFLYWRAGRLTAKNGGFRPGQTSQVFSDAAFESSITILLQRYALEMFATGEDERTARQFMQDEVSHIQRWGETYLGIGADGRPRRQTAGGGTRIVKVLQSEENIWSPLYGLKGKIDLTVLAALAGEEGQVRKTPCWPRSWANFSLLYLYSHMSAWANWRLLGRPDAFSRASSPPSTPRPPAAPRN